MYTNLDLSANSVDYEVFKSILTDNGYRKNKEVDQMEEWIHNSTGNLLLFPRNENQVPTDFVLHALNRAGISSLQLDMYRDLIFNK